MESYLELAINQLKKSGHILYPTDTVYGLGCDATNFKAVSKIYNLKQRDDSKALICLVSDLKMLEKHVEYVPKQAYKIIELAANPTTIIYDNPVGLAENLIADDNTIAIRVISSGFAHDLIKQFRKPIVSTSANISGNPAPKSFDEISLQILKDVDYVVNLPCESKTKPSTIIKLGLNGEVKIIRA